MAKRYIMNDKKNKAHESRIRNFDSLRIKEKNLSKVEKRKNRQERRLTRIKKKAESSEFYDSREWKELRYKILRKYGFKCLACGSSPPLVILHVDHIKPRINYPQLTLDPENLQVLCAACNQGKRHYFEDDLRPKP